MSAQASARPAPWVVPFFFLWVISTGCTKPDKDLGLDLLPGDPLGILVDTATLHVFTYADSAIRTSGLTRNLLGSYLDPQFGHVRAGIVAQVRISANNIGEGQDNSGLVADSIVLALAFDGSTYGYGGLNPQVFNVHEISENLSPDSLYESDHVPATVPGDLVHERGRRITPRPLAQVIAGGDTLPPQLRIRLDNALADRFLDAFGTDLLSDNASFLDFFKGLYITVDNGQQVPFQQGILYFNLLSAASNVTLYYRNTLLPDPVPVKLEFPINQNSVRYTVVEHDHAQALDLGLAMALSDTITPAERAYVQALGGLRTVIRFPHVMDYAQSGSALAKAELVVPVGDTYNAYLVPPAQLFLFRRDDAGVEQFLPDQTGGIGSIGGNFSAAAQEYRFNITRYVQGVLNGSIPGGGVEMVAAGSGISANRVVLAGPAAEGNAMRLRLTFTTY